jgi:5'-phosphate synthase pdxT subunit
VLARAIDGRPTQYTLKLLDVKISRNAYGAQVHSFEDAVYFSDLGVSILGVFIRAPVVTDFGPEVKILAEYNGQVVAVKQGALLGTSFHPELTEDSRLHEYFLTLRQP